MEGLKLMFVEEGEFADLTTSQKILFCKNFTEIGNFFLLPLFLLLCFQRAKDVKLQGFDPREMAQAHDTVAVL